MRVVLGLACVSCWLACGCGPAVDLNDFLLNPDPVIGKNPGDIGYAYESVSVPVAEGRSVAAWHVRSEESKALVVVIPGAAQNKSVYLVGLPMIIDSGYDALLMDYEGFGESPGTATLQHAADDALAVVGYAMGLHSRVVLYGISLGSALATRAAAEYPVAALAIDGVLVMRDEISDWVQGHALPAMLIGGSRLTVQVPEDYDIVKYIAQAHGAKLVMHSPEDTLTPLSGAQRVFDAASPPKTFWQEYYDHGGMILLLPDTYRR